MKEPAPRDDPDRSLHCNRPVNRHRKWVRIDPLFEDDPDASREPFITSNSVRKAGRDEPLESAYLPWGLDVALSMEVGEVFRRCVTMRPTHATLVVLQPINRVSKVDFTRSEDVNAPLERGLSGA